MAFSDGLPTEKTDKPRIAAAKIGQKRKSENDKIIFYVYTGIYDQERKLL